MGGTEEAEQLEQSIMKLVNYAKGRVKFEEFNNGDKSNLMELFVTNEDTLIAIYNALFPKKNGAKLELNYFKVGDILQFTK